MISAHGSTFLRRLRATWELACVRAELLSTADCRATQALATALLGFHPSQAKSACSSANFRREAISLRRGARQAQLFRVDVEAGRLLAARSGYFWDVPSCTTHAARPLMSASFTSNKPSQSARDCDHVTLRGGTSDWLDWNRALVRTLAPLRPSGSFASINHSSQSSDLQRADF